MDSPESVMVIAHWQTTEAAFDSVLRDTAELRARSLAESGCLGYEAFQNAAEPASVVIIERYRDAAAQQAHLDSSHYQELVVERIRPVLVDRKVEILRLRELT